MRALPARIDWPDLRECPATLRRVHYVVDPQTAECRSGRFLTPVEPSEHGALLVTLIVVPWRDDGHRSAACRAVCEHLKGILPGIPIFLTDSGHEPFNRAASRNLGVGTAASDEILVVCDADTIPEAQSLKNAIARAYDGRLHYPFAVVNYLTEAGTALVLAGQSPDPARIEFSIPSAQGGVMVMRASAWLAAGGMDERFEVWGYEDNAWYATVAKTIGPPIHHAGVAWHLWHPHDRYAGTIEQTRNFLMARQVMDG